MIRNLANALRIADRGPTKFLNEQCHVAERYQYRRASPYPNLHRPAVPEFSGNEEFSPNTRRFAPKILYFVAVTNSRRQRQKELHRTRVSEQRRAQKKYATWQRLKTFVIGVVILALFGAVVWAISSDGATTTTSSTSPTAAPPTTTADAASLVAPPAGAQLTGDTPCPATDGTSERTTVFASAPPKCIDEEAKYAAVFDTSKGTFTAELDPKAAPIGVNNFIVLARYKFYDGIPFHRIAPDFALQAGDPIGEPWGTHGPGYTIEEEPPADLTYEKYDLAMANSSSPKSTGSQFFVASGDTAALNGSPTYTYLGKVVDGTDVIDTINKVPTAGANGDTPTEAVIINSVTIEER